MATNFHIDRRIAKDKDIQRAYQFELLIPNIGRLTQEDFTFRVRSAVIPGRGNDAIVSTFLGQDRHYPGRPTWGGNQLTVEIEEYEDQKGMIAINDWNQRKFDANPKSPDNGAAQVESRANLCRDVSLVMYKYNGEKMPKKCVFYNTWVETIGEASLNYTSNDSVKFSVQFKWDYWLIKNS